jgi:hypothetical protein
MVENRFNPSLGKRLLGIIACSIAGILGGVSGSLVALLMGEALQAGLLGQNEPGFISPILSGGWVFGIFGIIPGLLIGFSYGITNNDKIWISVVLFGFLTSCASEIIYGYPTNVRACLYYFVSPTLTAFFAAIASSRFKIWMGLMPPEQAKGFRKADEEWDKSMSESKYENHLH